MIVVTGAAGMIGSGVVRHLNDLGMQDLVLVDDLKSGEKWKNLLGKKFSHLLSKHSLFEWLEGKKVDAIVHLGACSDTVESNVDYLIENNSLYTLKLAKWAVSHGARFIYASSAATYGDGKRGFADDEEALDALRPLNPYGFSKHLADLWLRKENLLNRVVGLKYFNIFGPNENHKGHMASMIYKMCAKVERDGVVELFKSNDSAYADGAQVRDFLYVKDAVAMTCAFLSPGYQNVHGIFNIGAGKPVSWNELADALFKALGKETNISYIDMPKTLARQYQNYTCAKMDKFHKIFPHFRATPIKTAVEEYVQQYLLRDERW